MAFINVKNSRIFRRRIKKAIILLFGFIGFILGIKMDNVALPLPLACQTADCAPPMVTASAAFDQIPHCRIL
jgi:hypothetical protein